MAVDQKTPEQIMNLLSNRINATNSIWELTDDKTFDQEKLLYFKYYMDLSVAIEATLRGIAFEYAKDEIFGITINEFVEPGNSGKSFFLDENKIRAVTRDDKLFSDIDESNFLKYKTLIPMLDKEKVVKFGDKEESFNKIKQIRTERNTLAHGLEARNVNYTKTRLLDFMYVFYLLHNYYESIFAQKHSSNGANHYSEKNENL